MQTKTTALYHCIFIRIAEIKKTGNTKVGENVEELEWSYTAGSNENDTVTLEKCLAVSKKLNGNPPYHSASPLLGI